MPAKIIDGVAISSAIRAELGIRAAKLATQGSRPGLAVLIVGSNPASALYVRNKIRACEQVGIQSFRYDFPVEAHPSVLLSVIADLNADRSVHGILVQLPLPPQFSTSRVLQAISAEKDVDGFHLYNVGGLMLGDTVFPPCTPYGVVKLLEHERIKLEGQNVVVVGAGNLVGKPMALMLMQRDATVCICHAKTRDLRIFLWLPPEVPISLCRKW
jgi:methylenetetrahydrofolate dehydrogenase (NADP+) / methenyltetrahydrofolate cyclohydrolase